MKGDFYEPGYFMSSSKSQSQASKIGREANVYIKFDGYGGGIY